MCGVEKSTDRFRKYKASKDGLKSCCKKCMTKYDKNYRKENTEKIAKFYKKYNAVNKDIINKKAKERYAKDPEKVKERSKRWRKNNPNCAKNYAKKYKANNINYKISNNLRARLYCAIKGHYKSGSAIKDRGCSINELKTYFKSLFKPGMTWDNYGKWHIDHIIPLVSFDLSDRKQFLKACHYSNLQPLWAKDNLSKGSKMCPGN